MNNFLKPYITFDELSRTILFSGDESSKSLAGKNFFITVKLVNENGNTSTYVLTLQVAAEEQELLSEEAEPEE